MEFQVNGIPMNSCEFFIWDSISRDSDGTIPDDSFGGYEIAPKSQILYLDIQTLQPPRNIFNMRKYKRHNIISHNFKIKNIFSTIEIIIMICKLWVSYLWKSFLFRRNWVTPFQQLSLDSVDRWTWGLKLWESIWDSKAGLLGTSTSSSWSLSPSFPNL